MLTRSAPALCAGLLTAVMASTVMTQTVDDFDGWMRIIDDRTQSVQQSIARKDGDAAVTDARALQSSFKQVEEFWARRDDGQDAVTLSREARERTAAIEKAAAARDFESASSEAIRVAGTCTACHRLHRPLS